METEFQTQPVPHQPEVSFPQPREPQGKGSNAKIIIAVIGVILILVAGGWFILGNNSGDGATASPTPNSGLSTFPTPEATSTPEPTPTEEAKPVDKSEISIEVLNGTGVPGEASFLQGELEDIGFEDTTAGNADDQDATETVATYSRELSATVADEITAKLEELYETVRTRRATITGDFDVSITTGTRKKDSKATSSPKASASAKASATPTASPDGE